MTPGLTPTEAAERLGVPTATLVTWLHELPIPRSMDGGHGRLDEDALAILEAVRGMQAYDLGLQTIRRHLESLTSVEPTEVVGATAADAPLTIVASEPLPAGGLGVHTFAAEAAPTWIAVEVDGDDDLAATFDLDGEPAGSAAAGTITFDVAPDAHAAPTSVPLPDATLALHAELAAAIKLLTELAATRAAAPESPVATPFYFTPAYATALLGGGAATPQGVAAPDAFGRIMAALHEMGGAQARELTAQARLLGQVEADNAFVRRDRERLHAELVEARARIASLEARLEMPIRSRPWWCFWA